MVKAYDSLSRVIGMKIDFVRPICLIYFLYSTLYHHTITIQNLVTATLTTTTTTTTASNKNNNHHQCQQRQKQLEKAGTTSSSDWSIGPKVESHLLTATSHGTPSSSLVTNSNDLLTKLNIRNLIVPFI